jgi:hypothetical protein
VIYLNLNKYIFMDDESISNDPQLDSKYFRHQCQEYQTTVLVLFYFFEHKTGSNDPSGATCINAHVAGTNYSKVPYHLLP